MVFNAVSIFVALTLAYVGPGEQTADSAKALILCDGSAGSVEEAEVWTHVLAKENPRVVTLSGKTDLNAFELPDGEWQTVFLFAEHRGEGTSWLESILAFALDHPKSRIHLFLWKSPKEVPDDREAMFATTAMAIWWNGHTTFGYTGTQNDDPRALRARTVKGIVLPDFKDVVLAEPATRFQLAKMERDKKAVQKVSGRKKTPLIDCQTKYVIEYRDRSLRCVKEDKERQQDCIELYAPQGNDPGDFDALGRCIQEGLEDLTNSLAAAGRDSRRGMALCEKRHGGATAPVDPNPN